MANDPQILATLGDGYHLTVVYGNNGNHADTQGTLNLLQKHVQSAKMHSFVGQEGTFLLSASERDKFVLRFVCRNVRYVSDSQLCSTIWNKISTDLEFVLSECQSPLWKKSF